MQKTDDTLQQHELFFAIEPAGQADRAFALLQGLDGLQVGRGSQPNSLNVSYHLEDYSLEGLERALMQEGFCFANSSLLQRIGKTLAHYSEDVQYHNLNVPERNTKKPEREIFVTIYQQRPHGDHDDTPLDLRLYK